MSPRGERDVHGEVALLLLGDGVRRAPLQEVGLVVLLRNGGRARGGSSTSSGGSSIQGVGSKSAWAHSWLSCSSTSSRKASDADAVDVELDAGAHPVLAELGRVVEDADGGLRDAQVVGDGHEVVERPGVAGHNRRAAADADLEPLLAVLELGG